MNYFCSVDSHPKGVMRWKGVHASFFFVQTQPSALPICSRVQRLPFACSSSLCHSCHMASVSPTPHPRLLRSHCQWCPLRCSLAARRVSSSFYLLSRWPRNRDVHSGKLLLLPMSRVLEESVSGGNRLCFKSVPR